MGTALANGVVHVPDLRACSVMNKRLRDIVIALAALAALLVMIVSINPRVRERAGEVTADMQWDTSSSAVQHVFESVMTVMTAYAGDNIYLFAFLVAACLLGVMMLRVL
jgi:hypothetical protein